MPRALVQLPRLISLLAEELVKALQPEGGQLTGLHGGPNGAARLGAMLAVPKPAVGGALLDIRERPADRVAGLPELQLAHSRRIDEHPLVRQHHELARGADVASPAVRRADLARAQQLVADELIHD